MGSRTLQVAVKKMEAVGLLKSKLSAQELREIRTSIRQQAVFSAKVSNGKILQEIRDLTIGVLNKRISPFAARDKLRETVERSRYKAPQGKEGTIQDLTSNARLDLIIRTNVDMARGYGQFVDAQRDLDAYPYWEMYRKELRQEPRDWPTRWREAGRSLRQGKMVAPVNDRVWRTISAFGTPYPPFDYNSGMSVRRMARARGEKLGLRFPASQKERRIPPMAPPQANVTKDPKLAEQLLKDLGTGYEISRGVIRGKTQ